MKGHPPASFSEKKKTVPEKHINQIFGIIFIAFLIFKLTCRLCLMLFYFLIIKQRKASTDSSSDSSDEDTKVKKTPVKKTIIKQEPETPSHSEKKKKKKKHKQQEEAVSPEVSFDNPYCRCSHPMSLA